MSNSPNYSLPQSTIMALTRHVRFEERCGALTTEISALLNASLSPTTLSRLDLAFWRTGIPSEINQVSVVAIQNIFDREIEDEDKELIEVAWKRAYRDGLCEVMHSC